MDLVQLIKTRNIDVPVVFISAYKEYAVNAIRNQVYDFLLKPVSRQDLKEIIEKHKRLNRKDLPDRLMEILNSIKEETKIRINSNGIYILINPADIVYCLAEEGFVTIYLRTGKTEKVNTSLAQINKDIRSLTFYHLGRNALINLDYIRSINKVNNTCTLKCFSNTWQVQASNKSIRKLLKKKYNHA